MKSVIKPFFLILFLFDALHTKADNILSINNLSMAAGESLMVDLFLDNTEPICAFNISIQFPEGFACKSRLALATERNYIEEEIGNEKNATTQYKGQTLKLIIYDSNNIPFSGNSGPVCQFNITASEDIAPGEYTFNVTKASVSDPNAVSYKTPDFTFTVTITPSVVDATGIALNRTALYLEKGYSAELVATVAPYDATDQTVVWSSSNESVATVSNGYIVAVDEGTAVITATLSNGITASCEVFVTDTSGIARVADSVSGSRIHTLQGVSVDNATTLPSGIYIRNGRKVVVGR